MPPAASVGDLLEGARIWPRQPVELLLRQHREFRRATRHLLSGPYLTSSWLTSGDSLLATISPGSSRGAGSEEFV